MIHLSAFADEIDDDPEVQLETLETLGVRHVEFRSIFGINVLDLSDAQHRDFRRRLRDRGFALSAIGSPIGKSPIGEPYTEQVGRAERAMDLAEFYDASLIRVFSFFLPPGDDPADHRDEVLRRMSTLAELARGRGLTLVLENEKGIYGDTAGRVSDVLETVDSPALGHAFDPANYLEVGQEIEAAWSKLKARTVHFHVKDYDPVTRTFEVAGQGAGQIPRLLADAVASGYSGFATLEPHLLVAGASRGFTGPERFGDAVRALRRELDAAGISHDSPVRDSGRPRRVSP